MEKISGGMTSAVAVECRGAEARRRRIVITYNPGDVGCQVDVIRRPLRGPQNPVRTPTPGGRRTGAMSFGGLDLVYLGSQGGDAVRA